MSRAHARMLTAKRLARDAVWAELREIRRMASGRLCHFGLYSGYQVVITSDQCDRIDQMLKAAK